MINLAKAEFKEVEQKMENINNDERILDEKIERRERDLEQSHKRLAKTQVRSYKVKFYIVKVLFILMDIKPYAYE